MANTNLLQFINVSKYYRKELPTLEGISFSIKEGEFCYLTGGSGSGKTTFLKLIYRNLIPEKGIILYKGYNIATINSDELANIRREIGIVFQDFKLLQDRSVFENIALPLIVRGENETFIENKVKNILYKVGLIDKIYEKTIHLSGGEQQRVSIARALVIDPKLILADEPTGNLDSYQSARIMSLFEDINSSGIAVIIATHDAMLIANKPHNVNVLYKGRLIEATERQLPPQVLYGEEKWFE